MIQKDNKKVQRLLWKRSQLLFGLLLLMGLSGVSWGVIPDQGARLKKFLQVPERIKDGYTCELADWLNNRDNYNKPLSGEGGLSTGLPWFVVIDQTGVESKAKPSSDAKVETGLNYLDIFMVAEEDGPFLHIAKDPSFDVEKMKFSKEVVDYGWIHRNQALLWNKTATTCEGRGKMARKAIPLNTIESMKEMTGVKIEKDVYIYTHPDLTNHSRSNRRAQLFQIFYIYKESGQGFLLGTQPQIYGIGSLVDFGAHKDILGWVKKDQVIHWDHRMAVEPNFVPEAIQEREIKGQAHAYKDPNSASKYQEGHEVSKAFWKSSAKFRRPGTWRRFPIQGSAESFKEGMAKVAVMGEITSPFGSRSAEDAAKEEQVLNARQRNAKVMNMVLVVQGNSSMLPYIEETKRVLAHYDSLGQLSNFRLGAVIYRGRKAGEKMINQHINANNNWRLIIDDFLKPNLQPGTPQASADGLALFYGIRTAVRDCDLKEDQSNYLIILGDKENAGLGDAFITQETLVKDLRAYNSHLMFFQTQHRNTFPYINYGAQAKEILRTFALADYEENKAKLNKAFHNQYNPPFLKEDPKDNTFSFLKNTKASSVRSCTPEYSLKPSKYGSELKEIFKGIKQNMNALDYAIHRLIREGPPFEDVLKELKQIIPESDNPYIGSFSTGIIDFLVDSGLDSTTLAQVLSENHQVFSTCYAPIVRKGHDYPLLVPVLMMTRDEVAYLLDDMEKFLGAGTDEERRERFYNTWVQLLRAHVGAGDLSKEALKNMTIEEVNEKIFGIPSVKGVLTGVRLSDIPEPRIVSNEQLATYEREVSKKFGDIKSIWNMRDHEISFESNETTYYWLEQDLFP